MLGEKNRMLKKEGYICRELLGKGAFSEVYRAEDEEGRAYACKISSNIRLLEREAEAMRSILHPLFPAFFGYWENGDLGCIVMEHVPGECLETMLRRRGAFCAGQVVRTGVELAEGLLYLHERGEGMLFRDVKPANIIVRQDGRVKLLDLGCICAKGVRTDSRAGTPGFCAPEQMEERSVLTESCDVYGLGRTLEAMLGGKDKKERGLLCRPGGGAGGFRDRSDTEDGKRGFWGCRSAGNGAGGTRDRRNAEAGKRGFFGCRSAGGAGRGFGNQPRSGAGGCRGEDRLKYRRELEKLLESCTRQEAAGRIGDMRAVMAWLLELEGHSGGGWRREIRCRKNIRECTYKNT